MDGLTDVELHQSVEKMLGSEWQGGENVSEDALLATIGWPDAAVEDGDKTGFEVGILDVFGASEEGDAKRDKLITLGRGDDVGEIAVKTVS